jgi:hypothetical protein
MRKNRFLVIDSNGHITERSKEILEYSAATIAANIVNFAQVNFQQKEGLHENCRY